MKLVSLVSHKGSREVFLNGFALNPEDSQKIRNHSPDGFGWGYGGSGSAQLALAILLEETDTITALRNYHQFKADVISRLPKDGFNRVINLQAYI